jgi:hypothetical protein
MLKQFQPGYTLGWLRKWDYVEDCTSRAECRKAREKRFSNVFNLGQLVALTLFKVTDKSKYCAKCKEHRRELLVSGRQKSWQDLPGFFDLPPWSELTNEL